MNHSKVHLVDLLLLSVVVIWGVNYSVLKWLYRYFDPIAFNALRFLITSLTMVAVLKLRGSSLRLDRSDIPEVIGLGLLSNTAYQFLFVLGLANTKAGNGALIMTLTPIFAYLAGVFLTRERFNLKVLGGIVLSMAGVSGSPALDRFTFRIR